MCIKEINFIDRAYLVEIINYSDFYRFALMDEEEMKRLRSRINVPQKKLDALLSVAFHNRYLHFIFDSWPYMVCTTNKGLEWAAPAEGEVPL